MSPAVNWWRLWWAVDTSNMNIKHIVDKHAPEQVKVIILRPNAPCYNDQRNKKNSCERKYKRTNLENDKQNYIVKCKTSYKLLDDSKRTYYSSRINQLKTNSTSVLLTWWE